MKHNLNLGICEKISKLETCIRNTDNAINKLEKMKRNFEKEINTLVWGESFPLGSDIIVKGIKYQVFEHKRYSMICFRYKKDGGLSRLKTRIGDHEFIVLSNKGVK